jgi:hypothetical protein
MAWAFAASLVLSTGASAATIDALKGNVQVSTKKGFATVKTSATVVPNQTVRVKAGGMARIMCAPGKFYEMSGPGRFKVPADCKVAKR